MAGNLNCPPYIIKPINFELMPPYALFNADKL